MPVGKDPHRAHAVYRCYDADGWLLYVGSSYRPESRVRNHRGGWGDEITTTTVEWFGPTTGEPSALAQARAAETAAIKTEHPLHNQVHSARYYDIGSGPYTLSSPYGIHPPSRLSR